jgi:hypothetical protein
MKITQLEISEIIAEFQKANPANTVEVNKAFAMEIMHDVGMLDEGYELNSYNDTFLEEFWEIVEDYILAERERYYERRYFDY